MLDGDETQPTHHVSAVRAMGLDALHARGWTGRNVIIGFPDYGFDLAHRAFRATSSAYPRRFRALWSQADGLVARGNQLDPLANREASYDPHANYYGPAGTVPPGEGAHGTLMASIAAGSCCEDNRGTAPGADIIGVHLDLPDTAWREESADGRPDWLSWQPCAEPVWHGWKSYADAAPIVDAIDFIADEARTSTAAGLVINLSVGTWAGPHDGTSAVSRKIAETIARADAGEGPPCIVVVAAGNAGADEGHVSGDIGPGQSAEIVWRFHPGAKGADKLEIWIDGGKGSAAYPARCTLAPTEANEISWQITPGCTVPIEIGGIRVGIADYTVDVTPGRSRIRISLAAAQFAGRLPRDHQGLIPWTITLETEAQAETQAFHAWRERNDSPRRSTLAGSEKRTTLCDFACTPGVIVAGGYDHTGTFPGGALPYVSRGPRIWPAHNDTADANAIAPHVGAPAFNVRGACSLTDEYIPAHGTSVSAALVSGAVAVLLQRAAAQGIRLDRDAIVAHLTAGASDAPEKAPDPAIGYGRAFIDIERGSSR